MTIQEVQESPTDGNIADRDDQRLNGLRHQSGKPTEQSVGGEREIDELLGQIDRDRVHTDHLKKQGPFTKLQHIDNIKKQRKHPHGVCSDNTDE